MHEASKTPSPLVSIILPAFNAEKYIREAIESVLLQDYKNIELLIIDDCSTDATASIINSISDPRITFIKNDLNLGLIRTLNKGLGLARGNFIGRIDADDVWHDNTKISLQMQYFYEYPDTILIGTDAIAIDDLGNNIFQIKNHYENNYIKKHFLIGNPFIHPSVIFKKDKALEVGGFLDEDLYIEDYSLWLRMGKIGAIANIPKPLMKYRIHNLGVSQKNTLLQIKNSLLLIKKYKRDYGGYWTGFIKWHTKLLIIKFSSIQVVNNLKRLFN